jgi:hypothetical protein
MTTEKAMKLFKMIKSFDIQKENTPESIEKDCVVRLPLFWAEDSNGNINFDTDSIRETMDSLIDSLENFNKSSDFDFDN